MAVVVTLVAFVLASPWSFHMGSRWTPGMLWNGYGKVASSSGADSEMFIELYVLWQSGRRRTRTAGSHRSDNITGTAIVCTAQGEQVPFDVRGTVDAWLDADNKEMTLRLTAPKNSARHYSATLYGGWQGTELYLEDRGTLAPVLNPPVAPPQAGGKNHSSAQKQVPAPKPQPATRSATLEYGKKNEFDAMCRSGGENSF